MRSSLLLTERGIRAVAHFNCQTLKVSGILDFIVDTGSERSFLGWDDAQKVASMSTSFQATPSQSLGSAVLQRLNTSKRSATSIWTLELKDSKKYSSRTASSCIVRPTLEQSTGSVDRP